MRSSAISVASSNPFARADLSELNFYKDITCWENRRRLGVLIKFRTHVDSYFKNSPFEWMGDGRFEEAEAKRVRPEIDRMMEEVHGIVRATGVFFEVGWTPPNGGHVQNIDILRNLFEIDGWQIEPNRVLSMLDRAIGVYQSEQGKAVCRSFNPFWWIGRFLKWFAHLPFRFIGSIGFDTVKAEGSIIGRLIKLIFVLLSVFASLLKILHYLGWLDTVKFIVGIAP